MTTREKRKLAPIFASKLEPEGPVGGVRRTPRGEDDPLRGKGPFLPSIVIAKSGGKEKGRQITKWLTCWRGYGDEAATYEPAEHLGEYKHLIKDYLHSTDASEARIVELLDGNADDDCEIVGDDVTGAKVCGRESSSRAWECFAKTDTCNCDTADGCKGGKHGMCLIHERFPQFDKTPCRVTVRLLGNTTNLWSHLKSSHLPLWLHLKGSTTGDPAPAINAPKRVAVATIPREEKAKIDRKLTEWIARRVRPKQIVEDVELRDAFEMASRGGYKVPCRKWFDDDLLRLADEGVQVKMVS
eukprot:GHVU01119535.1.p1 GENE.GHVU01119535.1~~GHVU01119535.1.p1  ORF type:complete len:299 (-),score=30.39 GHVU01119535.1:1086-1982(-)